MKDNNQQSITPTEFNRHIEELSNDKFQSDTLLKQYDYLRITDTTLIPPHKEVIKINGGLISSGGGLTTVSGASKSGKSAFTGVLIAGAIATGQYDGFPDIEVLPSKGKAVVHLDTEQSRQKHQWNLKSVLKRAGYSSCPDNLLSYNIRQEDPLKYKQITAGILEGAAKKFGGIHLVVIDGGADYIKDVNSSEQSNDLVKSFEDLASKYAVPIIIIVHINPNGDKERGHFGSQLQRKSESILVVKTANGISYLEPRFLRNAGNDEIPQMQFKFDKERGYHTFYGIKESDAIADDLKRLHEVTEITKAIFLPDKPLKYNEALEAIMRHTKKQTSAAKSIFKEIKAHELIIQQDRQWIINKDILK